jgi:predicted Zn finger-like uncharacterized protein
VQTTCPSCSQAILVDDAKVPERAFSIRCPRCKTTVRMPGKGTSADAASGAPASPPSQPEAAQPHAAAPSQGPAGAASQLEPEPPGHRGRALVALHDKSQAEAVTPVLIRLGFNVDASEGDDDAVRHVEQGVYNLLLTTRAIAPADQPPTFYQRLSRLSADSRRRVFVSLVGNDYRTGDGMQAFTLAADLVLNPRDLGSCGVAMREALSDRQRLYQVFLDAQRRLESA